MNIPTLTQHTGFGCLATCYAMIKKYINPNFVFNTDVELELIRDMYLSDKEFHEPAIISKLLDIGCEVVFLSESKYAVDRYTQLLQNKKFETKFIDISNYIFEHFIKNGYVIITLVDKWHLDLYVRSSHYVLIKGMDEKYFFINDPWQGCEMRIEKENFKKFYKDVKDRFYMAPVIIAVKYPQYK